MAFVVKDRVKESSTTTGTGDFTLAGAITGFRAFSAVCSTSDTVPYLIEAVDGSGAPSGAWETGIGTYSAANTLTRTTVFQSSNADAAVNFAAGTKRVSIGPIAKMIGPQLIETLDTTSGGSVTTAAIPDCYSGIIARYNGVSHNNGSNTAMNTSFSNDGTNFTTVTANFGTSTAASVQWYGGLHIPFLKADGGHIWGGGSNIASDLAIASINLGIAYRCAGGIKYIRWAPAAGSFDAGSIDVYGLF